MVTYIAKDTKTGRENLQGKFENILSKDEMKPVLLRIT